MATPDTITPDQLPADAEPADAEPERAPRRRAAPSRFRDLFELTKPRITLMVVLTALVGFVVASPGSLDWPLALHTLLGTGLLAGGASALNQFIEREIDSRMRRTANRPLPAGRLAPASALVFGVGLGIAGSVYLAATVNVLTSILGAATLLAYILVYTPMKPRSNLNTLIGAVPGAIPPMMGATAVTGQLDALAWTLFGILFLWQMPHFLAIAWLYRLDYKRGGLAMLPVADEGGVETARQAMIYAAALLPVSVLPSVLGASGWLYLVGALLLGLAYLAYSVLFGFRQGPRSARKLILMSVTYLPILLILMVVDQVAT